MKKDERKQTKRGGSPIRESLAAAKANVLPALVLQCFALAVVLGYYFLPPFHSALQSLAGLKARGGFLYSALSTSLFGGLLPFLYLRLNPGTKAGTLWSFLPFYILYWAYRGVEIDALYRLQSVMFGSGASAAVIIPKVAFDQFVYNPVIAGPGQLLAYGWMNSGYDFAYFRGIDWKRFFSERLVTALVSTWGVWIPMVTIIYCLPSDLQIPLFSIVLCFWVLILTAITGKASARSKK
jgi:hypothetical protein